MSHNQASTPLSAIGDANDPEIELIFLGTGTSSSVPYVDCLTAPQSKEPCRTCLSALTPEGKKNIRRNTSLVVRVTAGKDRKATTLVIDVGKNFQAAAVEWFPKYGLREIDAVLLTHAHADAINGLDDLRGWTLRGAIQEHIDIYASQDTFNEIKRSFPYLVAKEFASGGGDVPDFKWHIIENKVVFEIKDSGISVTPFSVLHGRVFTSHSPRDTPTPHGEQPATLMNGIFPPDKANTAEIYPYLCFGFIIQDAIVYVSDVSEIPEDAWAVIQSGGRRSVLVIDCLRLTPHMSHFGLREAAAAIRRIGASKSYMTGFNHDVSQEEWMRIVGGRGGKGEESNEKVRKGIEMMREGLNGESHWVRPAYDGLRVMCQNGHVWDETYT